jgi:hypothetical protein
MLRMIFFAEHSSPPPMFAISLCSSHEQQKGMRGRTCCSNRCARQGQ